MASEAILNPSIWDDMMMISRFRGRGDDVPFYRCVFDYTFLQYMQQVKDKSILDIGSGEGRFCRTLKSKGAKRVVGVDISPAMIKYAQEGTRANSGCEYILGDARNLTLIDEFDFVTANDVLPYTQTLDELKDMCRSFYKNLKPGGKFLAISIDCKSNGDWGTTLSKYGTLSYTPLPVIDQIKRTQVINVNVNENEPPFTATIHYFDPEVYEAVFKEAGFKSFELKPPLLDPELMKNYPEGFWDVYLARPNHSCYIAEK